MCNLVFSTFCALCVCVRMCVFLCRGRSALSCTHLHSSWLLSRTNRQSWERPLARLGRNTTCFLWATVCLMIKGGCLRHAQICTESCWKPVSSILTYRTGKRRACNEFYQKTPVYTDLFADAFSISSGLVGKKALLADLVSRNSGSGVWGLCR